LLLARKQALVVKNANFDCIVQAISDVLRNNMMYELELLTEQLKNEIPVFA